MISYTSKAHFTLQLIKIYLICHPRTKSSIKTSIPVVTFLVCDAALEPVPAAGVLFFPAGAFPLAAAAGAAVDGLALAGTGAAWAGRDGRALSKSATALVADVPWTRAFSYPLRGRAPSVGGWINDRVSASQKNNRKISLNGHCTAKRFHLSTFHLLTEGVLPRSSPIHHYKTASAVIYDTIFLPKNNWFNLLVIFLHL